LNCRSTSMLALLRAASRGQTSRCACRFRRPKSSLSFASRSL
jgi:hypothetical protein